MESSHPAVALFLALGVIIAASRIGGSLARRVGQPRVLGELIIGVILGPTLLDMLHWGIFHNVPLEETIKELAELGVLLLMFLIGLEVNLKELAKVGNVAILAGILGALIPVGMTMPVMMYGFGYGWEVSLFAGVTMAATSVSISAQVLLELGYLRTKEGNALLATALIDDVLAILLVSVTIAVVGTGVAGAGGESVGLGGIVLIIARMLGYIVIAFLAAWYGLPRFMNWLGSHPIASQSFGVTAVGLVIALLFGWAAEEFGGVATITGSFIAGVGLSRTREKHRSEIEHSISYIAYGFLVPVFFIDVGLETNLRLFPLSAFPFAIALLSVAIISKVAGCGIGAKLGGFTNGESLRVGICMVSRGEVGLIIASLGISAGILTTGDALFGSLFLVILLTTLITPILVRWVFAHKPTQTVHTSNEATQGGHA